MKYKLSEKEAHNLLYSMWECKQLPNNFNECHSQYSEALEFTRLHVYFDMNHFDMWLTM